MGKLIVSVVIVGLAAYAAYLFNTPARYGPIGPMWGWLMLYVPFSAGAMFAVGVVSGVRSGGLRTTLQIAGLASIAYALAVIAVVSSAGVEDYAALLAVAVAAALKFLLGACGAVLGSRVLIA